MTKQQLIDNGFKYITTQSNDYKIEMWAKFSGYEDTIQYYYYYPNEDATSPNIQTVSYLQLDMFAQMRDEMRNDLLKQDIKFDKHGIWSKLR